MVQLLHLLFYKEKEKELLERAIIFLPLKDDENEIIVCKFCELVCTYQKKKNCKIICVCERFCLCWWDL